MKEKENTSVVIYGMKENKNDMSDVKDVFDEMKCSIRVTTLHRLGTWQNKSTQHQLIVVDRF